MSKELELIAEALRDAGVRYYDVAAAGVVSRLSEHGYSIVPSTPGTCVDDPRGEHRWVQTDYGLPARPGWRCVDCHLHKRALRVAAAAAAEEDQ